MLFSLIPFLRFRCWLKPDKCQLMSRKYPNVKKPAKFDSNRFNDAIKDLNLHLTHLEESKPNLFKYYDNHTVFTVDRLYLSRDQNRDQNSLIDDSQQNTELIENPKKVLNSYNGIPFKTLKVNASKFDITSHIIHQKVDPEMRSPPIKRFKKGSPNKLKQNRCFSNAIAIREELSSSVESDQSFNDRSFSSQKSLDQNSSKNDFNENHFNSNNSETNDLKVTPVMSRSKTVTVSGKSSEILNLNNNVNDSFNNQLSETSNKNLTLNSSENDWKKTDSSPKPKSKLAQKSVLI